MRFSLFLLLTVLALVANAPVHADVNRYVGTGAGCHHATIQSAINAANNTDGNTYIRITRTLTYSNQQLDISSKNVVLTGGYADCNQTIEDSVHTVLSGISGTNSPLITVRGSTSFVGIYKLDVNDNQNTGTAAGAGFGGGIAVRGGPHVLVGLGDNHINGNRARFGGGLYVNNEFSTNRNDVHVLIGRNVSISNNQGTNAGGGVWCARAIVRMVYPNSSIFANTASTLGAPGGGIRAENCAVEIASVVTGIGSIAFNTAGGDGGGISATASSVKLYTLDAVSPTLLSTNIANGIGGAIAVDSNTTAIAWDVIVESNIGRSGGGAVAVTEVTNDGGDAAFSMRGDLQAAPSGAMLCASPLRCNRLSFNEAVEISGSKRAGAALIANSAGIQSLDNFSALSYAFYGTEVSSNSGATLISANGDFVDGTLRGAALFGNTASGTLIDLNAPATSSFGMYSSTIAGNIASGLRSIQRDASVDFNFQKSIHWQPGKTISGGAGLRTFDYVIANDLSNVAPSTNNLTVADPLFVNSTANDFHLQLVSAAVDYAPPSPSDPTADHGPRVVDIALVSNEFGAQDVGAYERVEDGAQTDGLFVDGFETR